MNRKCDFSHRWGADAVSLGVGGCGTRRRGRLPATRFVDFVFITGRASDPLKQFNHFIV
jgi:hypothetical protein